MSELTDVPELIALLDREPEEACRPPAAALLGVARDARAAAALSAFVEKPGPALRAVVTPAGRGRGARADPAERSRAPKHVSLTWMQRLRRVFAIAIDRCQRCGGALTIIVSIEEPALIERILAHPERAGEEAGLPAFAARAPPQPPLL